MRKTRKSKAAESTKPKKISKSDASKERPNDPHTSPNDSAPRPNAQPDSERTMGESERTNSFGGDVPALVADTIPATISPDASLPRPNEPMVRSDRPPNSAV